jgi:hypothetical protein
MIAGNLTGPENSMIWNFIAGSETVLYSYLIPAIVTPVPLAAWLNNGHVQTSPTK